VRKLQDEFGCDRENAAKMHDYQELKGKQYTLNLLVGGYCAWKMGPIQGELGRSYPLFRKTWMKVPLGGTMFLAGAFCANQFTTHFFNKLSMSYIKSRPGGGLNGVTAEVYQG
jgi:hypothetical protein